MNPIPEPSFIQNPTIQPLSAPWIPWGMHVDVLRLDQVHPIISGNKWYKLKLYLADALANQKKVITFGGGWSNHIIATAYACKQLGLQCRGYIRGMYDISKNSMLKDTNSFGMELIFLDEENYTLAKKETMDPDALVIPEGGLGTPGVYGIMTLKDEFEAISSYSHIICAAGTGTMAAGLLAITEGDQKLLAVNVTKNNPETCKTILEYTDPSVHNRLVMLEDYHFGGYAKRPLLVMRLMKETWYETALPLDFVYTARAFYAMKKEFQKAYFEPGSKVLFIHSGGLQGNRSIPLGLLPYTC